MRFLRPCGTSARRVAITSRLDSTCVPGIGQIPVARYVEPEEFEWLETQGCGMGFLETTAGPLVRSSYQENRLE